MTKSQKILYLILKELNLDNYNHPNKYRLIQKSIFLLKYLGFDLGYNFIFFSDGPCSSKLHEDILSIEDCISSYEEKTNDMRLNFNTIDTILKFKKVFDLMNLDGSWLELISCILYLSNDHKLNLSDKRLNELCLRHTNFNDYAILNGINFIRWNMGDFYNVNE